MWSKLRTKVHGKQARDGGSPAESEAGPGLDLPLGDDKLGEASPSLSLSNTLDSVEEHCGLFPLETADSLLTPGPAILE